MKHTIKLLCTILILAGCNTSPTISYSKKDLKKISWIEGNWKGMDGETPFYEIYKFKNDSIIEITSYEWNGTDSSNTSVSLLSWSNDKYYLGDNKNYNVVEITDSSIFMNTNHKANNSILWKIQNPDLWIAILKSKNTEKTYHMGTH